MAFRSQAYLTSMINSLSGRSSSTLPKLKYYHVPAAADNLKFKESLPKARKGDFVPVCMALGMIALSTTFGLHTAMQQLRHAPNVFVKKSRRETLPELVEPENVAEESDRFVKKSFFRKVAHIQQNAHNKFTIPNSSVCVYNREPPMETLKNVGVDPNGPNP